MPLIATRGAASVQGFGEFAQSGPVNYIEDVFSTFVYPGNWPGTGSTSSVAINPGVDLLTKGGMIWFKNRSTALSNVLFDTARGNDSGLFSNSDAAAVSYLAWSGNRESMTFTNTGATANHTATAAGGGYINYLNTDNFVSWLFRKQPKFFDIVTYTGNGSNRTISHNLGSTPGCIIVKRTDGVTGWPVYHRSIGASQALELQGNFAAFASSSYWNNTAPTSTVFTVGTDNYVNANGGTYVAYLFAHDAGGFGLTGSDNVISCGSVVGASQVEVSLGYEPQWILVKNASAAQDWWVVDNMRGLPVQNTSSAYNASNLRPNLSDAETTGFAIAPSATGFKANVLTAGQTYIYIAIRRGPMKTPTSGTSVFAPVTLAANGATNQTLVSTGFPVDLQIGPVLSDGSDNKFVHDRLRGGAVRLYTNTTGAEEASNVSFDWMTGMKQQQTNATPTWYMWRRAPGFFDEVCYTGTGSTGLSVSHNLGVMPELIIIKRRDASVNWAVGTQFASSNFTFAFLNTTGAGYVNQSYNTSYGFYAQPTSTAFTLDTASSVNSSAGTYVAYLFATLSGVSKVGSYTGTGALQTVNCGFTGGARFVLIKRTDSTGDWWVYDSARGISSGNDPYLFLNSTAAEVTNTNYVDTTSVGFQVTAAAPAGLNANGGTYIFLAIA